MKNIMFGKGGLTIKLDPRKWNQVGGGFDYINLMALIAGANPDITFWVCSKTRFDAADHHVAKILFPHGNVRFCPYKVNGNDTHGYINHYIDWVTSHGVVLDGGIVDIGIGSRVNIPNTLPKITEPHKKAMPATIALVMSAPTIQALNRAKEINPDFKWLSVHFDPKCNMIQRDLFCNPVESFAQRDFTYETQRWSADRGFYDVTFHHKYMPLEATAAFGTSPQPLFGLEKQKTVTFGIAMNGMHKTKDAQNRWDVVKSALNVGRGVQVYGKWIEDYVPEEDHDLLAHPSMKGSIDKAALDEIIKTWKYTVLSPTGKGWVTAKFYECLMAGVLPLLGPDYDDQHHLDVPVEMRIKSFTPDAIKAAIDLLEPNRIDHLTSLRRRYLSDGITHGTVLNQLLMERLIPNYMGPKKNPQLSDVWDQVRQEVCATSGLDF